MNKFYKSHYGLDFGAGTGPVIAHVLLEKSYQVSCYDPFFTPNFDLLNKTYDYIIFCEVIEHFHNPNRDFHLPNKLLNKNGILICQTEYLEIFETFEDWYYKNNPTHCFFYSNDTFRFIVKHIGFEYQWVSDKMAFLINR